MENISIFRKNLFLTVLTILVILFFIVPFSSLAIGIRSQPIEVKDILRGQVIEEKLNLNNSEDKEIEFVLDAEGVISDWVLYFESGSKENKITMISAPADSWVEVDVLIKVPDDLPNGEYTGSLSATYTPELEESESESVVTIAHKLQREVFITVTDKEIISFTTLAIPEKYILDINEPLKIKFAYENQGNIEIRPQAQVRILDIEENREIFNAIYPYPESDEAIKPFKNKEIFIEYPTGGLKEKKYRALVSALLNGEEKYKDDFSFIVGKADGKNKFNLKNILYAVLVIFIIVVAWSSKNYLKFKKANNKKTNGRK